ncbi:MAG: aspartate aminotransferase family protein [Candidatus Omnitrophica bacterium]|nr:aspartate aminotransferase family protein [Candidatus Omnitrophota bacterium]MBU1048083.1 aspartate aminotransferase family protein [Candidatus Omnitrophota bacterium]MBU1766604.1 aspartate aminotransferase family protein [Candidatus Omnitrophota bacterium]MBU1889453.1 aspartate aminotransferase family protein [Candidatus Omnitrophota bacterium]
MNTQEMIKLDQKYIIPTYAGKTIAFSHGKGCKIWDVEGKEYIDFLSGIAVSGLGHSHPKLVEAIKEQAEKLIHTSNLYLIPNQIELASILVENSFPGKCFFCNSGAEANEAAIKFARKYGQGRYEIITMSGSFHGRTYGALTATGQDKFHKGFEPLLPGFKYAEFNNIESVKNLITDKTCAILIEPVQGESGINPAKKEFLKQVRLLCDENDILLILDEVQCGMGRTGKLFAYEYYGITPDMVTLAKSLGGGVPIGAVIANEKVSSCISPGNHAATFGGNPLATKAAVVTLKTMLGDNLIDNAGKMGDYFKDKLNSLKSKYPFIKEVRGKGLMLGMEIAPVANGARGILLKCMEKGLLIGTAGENVLRFVPPLIVQKKEIDEGIKILEEVLTNLK